MDKSLILRKIKEFYKFRTDADFARFIGVTPQNLKQWYTRNTYDVHVLATFCKEIEAEWLLTGKGEMLKSPQPQKSHSIEDNIMQQPLDNALISYLKGENRIYREQIVNFQKEIQELNKQLGCLEGKLDGKEEIINILKGELLK